MGRRTVWWRAVAAAAVLLCAAGALSGPAGAAGPADPGPYAYAEDARTVEGTTTTTGAVRLDPGGTYRSSIGAGGKLYYRLELDGTTNAYVSATAVPGPGTTVASSDGLKVSVQDADSHSCSSDTARFGPTRSARPVTAWAAREAGRDAYMCQGAGTYYVVVERVDTGDTQGGGTGGDSGGDWGIELAHVREPSLRETGASAAPENWNSAVPEIVTGDEGRRTGGTSFATASPVGQGVWKETGDVRPGQTLYYKVPVDWGQQVYATAELGSSDGGGDGYAGNAVGVSLYNPVRALVSDVTSPYDGRQRSVDLEPLPPVRYENRFAVDGGTNGMRFAGWYYLAVHLGESVADRVGDGPYGLTLRVRVAGSQEASPGYLADAEPQGVFTVTAEDREAARSGTDGGAAGGGGATGSGGDEGSGASTNAAAPGGARGSGDDTTAMKLLAAGGIGTGSALVLWLGLWRFVARRRAAG